MNQNQADQLPQQLPHARQSLVQLVEFFNDEVLVQIAAAAWGLFAPTAFPGFHDTLVGKLVIALLALFFFCSIQVVIALFKHRSLWWGKGVTQFLLDALCWQPRMCCAQLAIGLAEQVKQTVVCRTGSPPAAVLALLAFASILLVTFSWHHRIEVRSRGTIWQYPVATINLGMLQFSARVCYQAWLFLARDFDRKNLWGRYDLYTSCPQVPPEASVIADPMHLAFHAFWSCALLLLLTTQLHRQLCKLVKMAHIEHREGVKLQKAKWFVAFVYGVGFPDYMLIVMVNWIGCELFGSEQLGYFLMYVFSTLLFLIVAGIAHRHYLRGCRRCIHVRPEEPFGAEWVSCQATGSVRLLLVQPGSVAAGRRSARGLTSLVGSRLISVNDQPVVSLFDALSLIDRAINAPLPDAAAHDAPRPVRLLLASRTTVNLTLEDALGNTAPQFLQRVLNNMFWWPFEFHVSKLLQVVPLHSNFARASLVLLIALSLNLLSVIIFVRIRLAWENYLQRNTMQRRQSLRNFMDALANEEGVSAGPHPQPREEYCPPEVAEGNGYARSSLETLSSTVQRQLAYTASTEWRMKDLRESAQRLLPQQVQGSSGGSSNVPSAPASPRESHAAWRKWYQDIAVWAQRRADRVHTLRAPLMEFSESPREDFMQLRSMDRHSSVRSMPAAVQSGG